MGIDIRILSPWFTTEGGVIPHHSAIHYVQYYFEDRKDWQRPGISFNRSILNVIQ